MKNSVIFYLDLLWFYRVRCKDVLGFLYVSYVSHCLCKQVFYNKVRLMYGEIALSFSVEHPNFT